MMMASQPDAARYYAQGYWRPGDLWSEFAGRAGAAPDKTALIAGERETWRSCCIPPARPRGRAARFHRRRRPGRLGPPRPALRGGRPGRVRGRRDPGPRRRPGGAWQKGL